jgi:hypothetical protein
MASKNSSEASFLTHLNLLRQGDDPSTDGEALEAIFCALAEENCERDTKSAFVAQEGILAVAQATKRPHNKCGQFYHSSCGIFFSLLDDDDETPDPRIADAVIKQGGLDCLLECMQSLCVEDAFLAYSCCGLVSQLFSNANSDDKLALSLAKKVLPDTLAIMERHGANKNDSSFLSSRSYDIFMACCDILGNCARPGNDTIKGNTYQRMVQCVWAGVICHRDYCSAQSLGRKLLCHLVGPEAAREMIDHAEMHHCEDADCSSAA